MFSGFPKTTIAVGGKPLRAVGVVPCPTCSRASFMGALLREGSNRRRMSANAPVGKLIRATILSSMPLVDMCLPGTHSGRRRLDGVHRPIYFARR